MTTKVLLQLASKSILKNKMRTLLTMLGIVIGVAAVIVMIAVGNGASSSIQAQIKSLGTNMIVITPGSTSQGGASQGAGSFNRLTIDDAEKLKREGTVFSGVSPVVFTFAQAIGNGSNWRTQAQGVATDFQEIRDWQTTSGDFFTDSDVRSMRKVVVLGNTVAQNLFPDGDAVGQQIQLRNVPFTVIGVLEAKGQTASGNDQDDVALLPYSTLQSRLAGRQFIGQILVSTTSENDIPAAQSEVTAIMREAHKLNEAEPDDFTVKNQEELAAAATGTTRVMSLLLAAIASISLLVGGIGIMNIMLVSVTERTREIGIRMAIGGRGSDVLTQFLVESVVMSLAGGLIGILAGAGGAALLGNITGWTVSTPLSAVVIAVTFSAAVGIFFGYYPARKAAALNPIEALRYE